MPKGVYVRTPENTKSSFKKGHTPFGRSLPGHITTEDTKRKISLKNSKGDDVGYKGVHKWLFKNYGNPVFCEDCGKVGGFSKTIKPTWSIHWSNKDHKYRRRREDYNGRCTKCHKRYDLKIGLIILLPRSRKGQFIKK